MSRTKSWVVLAVVSVISTIGVWVMTGMSKVYENYDGPYYAIVAKSWYDKEFIGKTFEIALPLEYYAAHLPLYPLMSQVLTIVPGLNILRAMVLVNVLGAVAGSILVYEMFMNLKWPNAFTAGVVWLFAWPRMWAVRSIASPETVFIVLIIGSLWCFEKRRYWTATILGSLAVLTKSPGILLFVAYGLWWGIEVIKTRKFNLKIWPIVLIPVTLVGLFGFYQLRMHDFWAYFHSGDNIHLQSLPFRVFNSDQPWVGTFWLEDIIWIYLVGALGVYYAFKRSRVWGLFGVVFFATIVFVSHRDISRYALPLVPVVLVGFAELLKKKEVRVALLIVLIPLYLYTINFMQHNRVAIANWTPFLMSSR